jgi:hypothetical protein
MTLDEIIKEKSWWYLPDNTYIMDDDWFKEYRQPAPYNAFVWWEQYTYRMPRMYFRIVIREQTEFKRKESKSKIFSSKYSVIVKGAISGVPLPIEIWEAQGTPWKSGTSMYIDPFYFGEKYRELDRIYTEEDNEDVTHSALIKGFDTLEEAREFVSMWKVKAIDDHGEQIKIEKSIMKLIQ